MEKEEKEEKEDNINLKNILEKETTSQNCLKDFEFILNRSKNIKKIINIENQVQNLDYIYTREEAFSDDILFYLTQLNDKINQYKYNSSLSNSNKNSNFHVYNLNYSTEIDVFFEYEYFKNEIHNNPKAYNVHEYRKVPFEEEKRGKRRNYQNEEGNKYNNFKKQNFDNRRSFSFDKINKNSIKNNYVTDYEKNKDKVFYGGIKEYKSNYKENDDEEYYNMENKDKRRKKRKDYCSGLTSYDPFNKKKKKKYKEDSYD